MARKGFITILHVQQKIGMFPKKERTKSAPSSSAQTFDLCEIQSGRESLHFSIDQALKLWDQTYPIMAKFARFQRQSGARVSEILRIHSSDISPEGRIHLRSLKNGIDRIIHPVDDLQWYISERIKGRFIFQDLTRFVVHHNYVKQGITAFFGHNTKGSTTHIFRHLIGSDLANLKDSTHAIKLNLGQKTDTAADHYKPQKRRENDH